MTELNSTAPPEEDAVSPTRRSARVAVAATLVLVLLGLAGGASYLAYVNRQRADRWQARANTFRREVDVLDSVVIHRTALLNARGRQLNKMAAKVQSASSALSQSEGDVANLEQRQRELANEKAQLEDQHVALTGVAAAYVNCKTDLSNALSAVANQDWSWIDANAVAVQGDCNQADDALQAYESNYPSG